MDIVSLVNKPNPVIFDIGANDGADTARFCKMFPDGKFYAFEPDPRAIAKFKSRNLPVTLFEGVVSDIDGSILFHQSAGNPSLRNVDPNWDASGSILNPTQHIKVAPWITFPSDIIVKSITLDTFTKQNNIESIDFIWADIQGAEKNMIEGGKDTFENKVRYLYTEYSNDLYENAPRLETILELLPNYELLQVFEPTIYGGDTLLKNMKFEESSKRMPYDSFHKYPNLWFVETGSHMGDGIQAALDANFKSIFSIEITKSFYDICLKRFLGRPEVALFYGDSVELLWKVIEPIWGPATFWLDGHWDLDPAETRGVLDFPLIKELEIIAQHPIKTHTIIIDDVRLFNYTWKIGHTTVLQKLLEINPYYSIHYEDGIAGKKNDVLIAQTI